MKRFLETLILRSEFSEIITPFSNACFPTVLFLFRVLTTLFTVSDLRFALEESMSHPRISINNYSQQVVKSASWLTFSMVLVIASAVPSLAQSAAPGATQTAPSATGVNRLPATSSARPSQAASPSATNAAPVDLGEMYTLGPGDRIHLDIFNIPEYTGERHVLVDGTVNLPLVSNVSVKGMTLKQAGTAISTAYAGYLRDPLVTISLVAPRPLRVSISGEVNRPGSYAVPFSSRTEGEEEAEARWPTATQAIQLAGGITQSADVRQVKVQRPQLSGTPQVFDLNLWELLQGDLQQDLALRDGDTILIPKATRIDPAEATKLATASFSPAIMRVNVVGEVIRPGVVELPPNTPLNQAVLAAGGFDQRRANKRSVELIRLKPDGTVSRREVSINLAQGINEQSNPMLLPNDVVVVGRSGGAKISDALSGIMDTVGRFFPVFGLFGR
jgi:polysaccharide export outer membrane protein